jgi:spore cortex biosynthesis protein YabQ
MNPAITIELQFFLLSILWGGLLLLAYDVLRIFRRLIKHGIILVAIEDLIFWLLASLFIFTMIFQKNNGIIRGFSIIGMLLGIILYHFSISEWLVNSITKLIQTLLSPIKAAIKQIIRFFRFLWTLGKKEINNLLYRLKKIKKSVKITLKTKKQ